MVDEQLFKPWRLYLFFNNNIQFTSQKLKRQLIIHPCDLHLIVYEHRGPGFNRIKDFLHLLLLGLLPPLQRRLPPARLSRPRPRDRPPRRLRRCRS